MGARCAPKSSPCRRAFPSCRTASCARACSCCNSRISAISSSACARCRSCATASPNSADHPRLRLVERRMGAAQRPRRHGRRVRFLFPPQRGLARTDAGVVRALRRAAAGRIRHRGRSAPRRGHAALPRFRQGAGARGLCGPGGKGRAAARSDAAGGRTAGAARTRANIHCTRNCGWSCWPTPSSPPSPSAALIP